MKLLFIKDFAHKIFEEIQKPGRQKNEKRLVSVDQYSAGVTYPNVSDDAAIAAAKAGAVNDPAAIALLKTVDPKAAKKAEGNINAIKDLEGEVKSLEEKVKKLEAAAEADGSEPDPIIKELQDAATETEGQIADVVTAFNAFTGPDTDDVEDLIGMTAVLTNPAPKAA